jgi:hypothetical protein
MLRTASISRVTRCGGAFSSVLRSMSTVPLDATWSKLAKKVCEPEECGHGGFVLFVWPG